MADISKCEGKGCKLKEICYRYTCPGDSMWQSYLIIEVPEGQTHCEMFWPDPEYQYEEARKKRKKK